MATYHACNFARLTRDHHRYQQFKYKPKEENFGKLHFSNWEVNNTTHLQFCSPNLKVHGFSSHYQLKTSSNKVRLLLLVADISIMLVYMHILTLNKYFMYIEYKCLTQYILKYLTCTSSSYAQYSLHTIKIILFKFSLTYLRYIVLKKTTF